jgi:MFS superfamily sulfate permease-like transporter
VKSKTFGTILSAFLAGIALAGCASSSSVASAPEAVAMGNNTYAITRVARHALDRDIDALKAQAMEDATRFCAARGKQLKVVSMKEEKPWISVGYFKVTIVFKALNAGDAELTAQPAPVAASPQPAYMAASPQPAPPAISEKPVTTGDLYNALMQLDDLRKKGILTEEEFQAEKQKVLRRSQ